MSPTAQAAAPIKAKLPKVCSEFIKNDDLKLEQCKQRLVEGRCINKDKHINKYKTNWCKQGWCEGSNPKDWKGNPSPTCKIWQTCPCTCHTMFDTMYSESGLPREVVNNSDYHVDKSLFWMPSPEERIAMIASSSPATPDAPTIVESPLPEAVPVTVRRSYTPTATGRAARGELEAWVKDQCDIWIVEQEQFNCTPVYLSMEIARTHGIKEPSVGAISAVFDRWTKISFAEIGKKPTRFIAYTEQGVRLGLEGCKDKAKRDSKSVDRAASRRMR